MSTIISYDRQAAVAYADRWAYGRNPKYYNYDKIGGDCTNFASQCIFAGIRVMNHTPVSGWYYNNANSKSPSWTGMEFLRNFLIRNAGQNRPNDLGPFAEETDAAHMMPGDVIQLSFNGSTYAHTPVVVQTGVVPALDNILVAAHTYDCNYRPVTSYNFQKIRFLHIIGGRK